MDAFWIALAAGAALLAAVALAGWLVWRASRSGERALVRRIAKLGWRDQLGLALDLLRDRRVPLAPRLIAIGLLLYLAMPLDIIPDFIPVLGYLDDLLLLVLAGGLLLRSVPRAVLEEHLARREAKTPGRRKEAAGRS